MPTFSPIFYLQIQFWALKKRRLLLSVGLTPDSAYILSAYTALVFGMRKEPGLPVRSRDISAIGVLNPAAGKTIPLYGISIAAGFPNPAEGWIERSLDLNDLCIRHPDSSYFVRVKGDSMIEAGIFDGDYLVVDRALPFTHNAIVIARVGAELTVKRLETKPLKRLVPANPNYLPIEPDGLDIELIGVATFAIKKLSP